MPSIVTLTFCACDLNLTLQNRDISLSMQFQNSNVASITR